MSGTQWTLRLALLTALVPAPSAFAAEQWLKIKSANFDLLTTAGERKGREAILYFEQVRTLFSKLSGSAAPGLPVRIIAFQSDKEYKPYRLNDFAAAYYTGSRDRDYIVMGRIDPELYPVAIHEYAHLIVKHAGLSLPAWLNEGLADVYSTLKPVGAKVLLGEVQLGRYHERQMAGPGDTPRRGSSVAAVQRKAEGRDVLCGELGARAHALSFRRLPEAV